MLTVLLLAAAIAAGAHPAAAVVAAVAVVEPRLLIAGAVAWAGYSRLRRPRYDRSDAEAAFLRALAAELRGGTSLRLALSEAAARVPVGMEAPARLARAGMPMPPIARLVEQALVHNGAATAAAIELSAWSGARTAAVFDRLADRAADAAELIRERRAATTQARLSAWVVGLAPLAFTALVLATGGVDSLGGAGGAGVAVITLGIVLEVAGLVVVALIVRLAS